MSLNKNNILLFLILLSSTVLTAQQQTADSLSIEALDEVVITGQYNAQSAVQSVFEVKVINRNTIEQQAANNLADLLNQTLNINILPNASTGKSGVSLFGLDSQYFKVLIDNVPVINEEGVGNNTDLTLINLDDIQQIEIIEGSMGVQYGSNAVSGIINIITKKSSAYKTQVKAYLQEETVGDEYEWFEKGRHIQSLQINHNFTDKLYGSIGYTRNDFAGYWGNKNGEHYDNNDGLRGHDWLPKLQQNAKALLNYKGEHFNIFYKFDYFNEHIEKYNTSVDLNTNPATETSDPVALDEMYTNNRYYHHINSTGLISNQVNYDVSVSYQSQTKDIEQYQYRIREDEKLNNKEGEYLSRKAFFSRGTFSNLIDSETLGLQLGYEITNEKGYGSPLAITINPEDNKVEQKLNSYDLFASSEFKFSEVFSIRPGARISFSNLFNNQYVFSLSSKYIFKNNYKFRAIIGSANRTPNYDELFTYFVDVNHNLQGNPGLNPEKGVSAFLHLKKQFKLNNDGLIMNNKISASYLDIADRIELIIVEQNPLSYQYNNIDAYTSFGFFSENSLQYKRIKAQLGFSVLGISKTLDTSTKHNNDFLYNLQLNSTLSYNVPEWHSSFALYYKHVGKQDQFVEKTNDAGHTEYVKGTTDAYSWLDLTARKKCFNNAFDITVGVRNILDVNNVNTTAFSGGTHDGPPSSLLLGYGRSYFIKLAYNLNL
ncbi:TonB-dependent receptor plug domain-containing protein [Formosa sp. 4Alg 33]|uniref:TonB-dependent receptor plug domain-containing protein n=1 Tax=Formosa sp. 4Alg 33 TaxID=3382189 RepID=UPI003D9C6109